MAQCPRCSAPSVHNANFCIDCGAELPKEAPVFDLIVYRGDHSKDSDRYNVTITFQLPTTTPQNPSPYLAEILAPDQIGNLIHAIICDYEMQTNARKLRDIERHLTLEQIK